MKLNEAIRIIKAKKYQSKLDYKTSDDILFLEGNFYLKSNDSNELLNNDEALSIPEGAKIIVTPYAKGIYADKFLNELAKRNIQLIKLDYYGNPIWEFHNKNRTNAFIMKAQILLNEPKFNKIRAGLISNLLAEKADIDLSIIKVNEKTKMREWIKFAMNIEGKAALHYWEVYRKALNIEDYSEKRAVKGIKGVKKNNRNATDSVNALLNLGYGILAHNITFTLYQHGFEPTIGFYHSFDYHDSKNPRYSLVWDIIEPYRAEVDDIVAQNLDKIDTEMFVWETANEKRFLMLKEEPHILGHPSKSEYKKWVHIFTEKLPKEYPFIAEYKRALKLVLEQSGITGHDAINRILGNMKAKPKPEEKKPEKPVNEEIHPPQEEMK